MKLKVMLYHYVRDAGDAAEAGSGIPGLGVGAFCDQVDGLARAHEMVSWAEVRAAVLGAKPLPANACLLTFDDGVRDHYLNVFPELQRRKLSGVFFALARENGGLPLPFKLHYLIARLGLENLRAEIRLRLDEPQRETYRAAEAKYRLRWRSETDVVKGIFQRDLAAVVNPLLSEMIDEHIGPEQGLAQELFLNDAQVREMRAGGMRFGGHSRTHPWFDLIAPAQRAAEIRASTEWLSRVEQAPFAFAYPYGGLAADAPQFLQQHQFCAAFTTREQLEHSDAYYIGRYDGEEYR